MKKYHVTINPSVYKKLDEIFSYIALESPKIAVDLLDGIEERVMSLESMPERFATILENITHKPRRLHHCFYKKFRIIYAIRDNEVRILDIRHGAQNFLSANDDFEW